MWQVRKLDDPNKILAFLERDRLYAAYAIADLEPELFQHTRWYVAEADGQTRSLAMLFTALDPDVLFLMGDPAGLIIILGSALRPRRVYASIRPEHLPVLRSHYRLSRPERTVRMVLDAGAFRPVNGRTTRLSPAYARQLERLYRMAQGNAFSAYQVAQGVFYGVTAQERLVATAGTHVLSETYSVAAVGNVFTHPEHRRQGLGTLCTGAVVQELLSRRIQTIVLNVHENNETALNIYKQLGFKEHCRYIEVLAERN